MPNGMIVGKRSQGVRKAKGVKKFISDLLMIKWISLFQFGSTNRIFFRAMDPSLVPGGTTGPTGAPQARQ